MTEPISERFEYYMYTPISYILAIIQLTYFEGFIISPAKVFTYYFIYLFSNLLICFTKIFYETVFLINTHTKCLLTVF